jgi:hypothetical protein
VQGTAEQSTDQDREPLDPPSGRSGPTSLGQPATGPAEVFAPWLLWCGLSAVLWIRGPLATGLTVAAMTVWMHRRHTVRAVRAAAICVGIGLLVESLAAAGAYALPHGRWPTEAVSLLTLVSSSMTYEFLIRVAHVRSMGSAPPRWLRLAIHGAFAVGSILGVLLLSGASRGALPYLGTLVAAGTAASAVTPMAPVVSRRRPRDIPLLTAATLIGSATAIYLLLDHEFIVHGIRYVSSRVKPQTVVIVSLPLISTVASTWAVIVIWLQATNVESGGARWGLRRHAAGWLCWAALAAAGGYILLVRSVPPPTSPTTPGVCPDGEIPPDGMDC